MYKIIMYPFVLLLVLFSSCNSTQESNLDQADLTSADLIDVEVPIVKDASIQGMILEISKAKLNPAQEIVQKLMLSCVLKNYSTAAGLIMYRGTDQSRVGTDVFNYANPNEANTVNVSCEVISEWLGAAKSYEFITYKEEQSEYGMQYVVEVLLAKQKLGIARHFFYFMDSPKGLVLVNMI